MDAGADADADADADVDLDLDLDLDLDVVWFGLVLRYLVPASLSLREATRWFQSKRSLRRFHTTSSAWMSKCALSCVALCCVRWSR